MSGPPSSVFQPWEEDPTPPNPMNCPHCGKEINVGALLGSAKSEAKTKAARENAKKGGWPKGKKRSKPSPP